MSDATKLTSDELLEVAEEIAGSFPPPRAGTELILLDVNPHRAHAYWHVDPADMSDARKRAGGSPLVIRMHDVTGIEFDGQNPHDTNDTVVSGDEGQADLHVRKSGRTYLAELGLRQPTGQLERLAISDPIELPRSPITYTPHRHTMGDIGDLARMELAGLAVEPTTEIAPATSATVAPVAPARRPATIPDWPDAEELAALLPDRSEKVEVLYEKTETTTIAITAAQEQMLVEIHNVPPVAELPETEAATISDTQGPAAFPTFIAAQPPGPIRLEDYLSYSSHNLGAVSEDVTVCVEFAVHGHVPTGRRVTLFGHEIPVDDEGDFLLRRELLQPGATLPGLFQQSRPVED